MNVNESFKAHNYSSFPNSDEEKKLCWAEVCVIVFSQERMIYFSFYSYVYSRDARFTGFGSFTSLINLFLANS